MSNMVENVKCPICGDTKIQRKDLDLAQCQGCLFLSPVSEFKWIKKVIEQVPPPEVLLAEKTVADLEKFLREMERELRIMGAGTTKDTVAEIYYQLRLIVEGARG